jgi:hypothetical protein
MQQGMEKRGRYSRNCGCDAVAKSPKTFKLQMQTTI